MRLWVRLTFGQTSGQVDLWSYVTPGWGFRSGWNLVRLLVRSNFGQMYPKRWGFGSHWHLVKLCHIELWSDLPPSWMRLWVRMKFGQTSGQVDLWSDVPPRMRLWVRMKFGQTYGQVQLWSDVPRRMRLWVRLTFGQTLGYVDLWSDVPL